MKIRCLAHKNLVIKIPHKKFCINGSSPVRIRYIWVWHQVIPPKTYLVNTLNFRSYLICKLWRWPFKVVFMKLYTVTRNLFLIWHATFGIYVWDESEKRPYYSNCETLSWKKFRVGILPFSLNKNMCNLMLIYFSDDVMAQHFVHFLLFFDHFSILIPYKNVTVIVLRQWLKHKNM